MTWPVIWMCDTIGGLWQLFRLGLMSGFRFKGDYWQWRLHTAFGRGYPATKGELIHATLEYGRWIHRMKRLGRRT